MNINKLIADMDLEIVDLSDGENKETVVVKENNGIVAINSENETGTHDEHGVIRILSEEAEINWDILEIESDNEEVSIQKELQVSDNSVLLLEAGSSLDLRKKGTRIDYNYGLNGNSDSSTCINNTLCLASAADDNLKESNGSRVYYFESKNCSKKMNPKTSFLEKDKETGNKYMEGANANIDFVLDEGDENEVSMKVDETGFSGNKGESKELDHDKSNLEGFIPNTTDVRGDSKRNEMDAGVQEKNVDANKRIERIVDQMKETIVEPLLDGANGDLSLNVDSINNAGPPNNNEPEEMHLGAPLSNILGSKSPKRRGRPRRSKGVLNGPSTDLGLVAHVTGENSRSRRKRDRKDSRYLCHPYINIASSPKKSKIDIKTGGGVLDLCERKEKDEKTNEPSQLVVDLISIAQDPLDPQQTNLTLAERGFLTSFRDSICSKEIVKTSEQFDPVSSGLTKNVLNCKNSEVQQDHGVLLDARRKLDEIISSLNGSDLERKESLTCGARELLNKIDVILTNDFTIGTFS